MTAPSPLDPDVIEAGAKAAADSFGLIEEYWQDAPDHEKDHWRSSYLGVVAELIERGILPRSTSSPKEGNRA